MGLSFFNLRYNPFVVSPTPDRLFRSRSYCRVTQEIAYSLEGRKGLVALLAPRGMGKKTLLHAYLDQRQQRNIRAIWLSGSSSTLARILDRLCAEYNVPVVDEIRLKLRALRSALRRVAGAGGRVVLIIEEADNLSARALADLLWLADLQNGLGKLLTIVLIGQPVLNQRLKQACSQALGAEDYRCIRVAPLQWQESMAYVQHLIAQSAEAPEAILTPGALRCVVRYARGNPGLINYVCSEALRIAHIEQQKPITRSIVRAVLNDLEDRQTRSPWRWGVAVLVGGLIIMGIWMGLPRVGPLWHQPTLLAMVTELVGQVKSLPSVTTWENVPPPSERPIADVAVEARPVPALKHEALIPSRSPVSPMTAPETRPPAPSKTRPAPVATPPPPVPAPKTNPIAKASLLCLTARPPGNPARDIILVDYHGKVQQRLVSDGALNLSPILSPDQRRLAYTSYREGTPSIYVRDLKNAKDERLTSRSGIALPGAWSPDGRYLVLSKSEDGNSDIFLYDLHRRQMRRLTSHKGIDISPSFAPDSKRLVFTSNRNGTSHIYLTDIHGRRPQRLTEQGTYNAAPAWSPQGSWIAFISRSPQHSLELYVMKDDGSELRQVTTGGSSIEEAPTWSPDGRSILYTRVHNGSRERRIVDVDGRNDHVLPGHGQLCYSPQWVTQVSH